MKLKNLLFCLFAALFAGAGLFLPEILEGGRLDPEAVRDVGFAPSLAMMGLALSRFKESRVPRGNTEEGNVFLNKDKNDRPYWRGSNGQYHSFCSNGNTGGLAPISGPDTGTGTTVTVPGQTLLSQNPNATIDFGDLSMDISSSEEADFIEGNLVEGVKFVSVIGDTRNENSPRIFLSDTDPGDLSDAGIEAFRNILPEGFDVWRQVGVLPIEAADPLNPSIPAFRQDGGRVWFLEQSILQASGEQSMPFTLEVTKGDGAVMERISDVEIIMRGSNAAANAEELQLGDVPISLSIPAGENFHTYASAHTEGSVQIASSSADLVVADPGVVGFTFRLPEILDQ